MFVFWFLFGIASADFNLLLLHTNDMHSVWSGSDASSIAAESFLDADYGGYIRLKAKKLEIESKAQESTEPQNILFLNGGDNFTGSPWFASLSTPSEKVQLTATFVKNLEFDALCPGNHEFDLKIDPLVEYLNLIGTVKSKTKRYLKYPADCYANVAEFDADIESAWGKVDITDTKNWYGEDEEVPIVVVANLLIGQKQVELRKKLRRSVVRIFQTSKNEVVAVGIVGYLTNEIAKDLDKNWEIEIVDEVEYVAKEVRRLTAMGVNIIVGLGHSGFETDEKIATIAEIDAVVGGHSNTFMYNKVGDIVDMQPECIRTSYDPPVPSYPVLIKKDSTEGYTPVVQSFAYTKYLGKLALNFDVKGQLKLNSLTDPVAALSTFTKSNPVQNPILLNDKLTVISNVVTIVSTNPTSNTPNSFSVPNDWIMDLNIWKLKYESARKMKDCPKLTQYLEGGDVCRKRECVAANVIVDAYMDALVGAKPVKPGSSVPSLITKHELAANPFPLNDVIGMTNGGGIRSSIGDVFTSVTKLKYVSLWDIMIVSAANGDVGIIHISRDKLLEAFKYSISQWKESDPTGRLLQVSNNVRVTYDFDHKTTYKIKEKTIEIPSPIVEILNKRNNIYYNIADAPKDTLFSVVTTPYLAGGRGGFDMVKSEYVGKKVLDWDVTMNYIKDSNKVNASRNSMNRIRFKYQNQFTSSIPIVLLN